MAAKVRISVNQEKLFKTGKKTRAKGAPRQKKRKEDLPENQTEAAVIGFLQTKGFTCLRQHRGLFRRIEGGAPFTVGLKGQCDWIAFRPIYPSGQRINASKDAVPHLILEFEAKAPKKRPSPDQLKYIRNRVATGTPATWADSLSMFQAWFEKLKFGVWIR